jgi:hypothetical protein
MLFLLFVYVLFTTAIADNFTKGYYSEHHLTDLYVYPDPNVTEHASLTYHIYSKDENHPNYRAGVAAIFMQGNDGKLFAVTTSQIFCQRWEGTVMDKLNCTKQEMIGKVARLYTLRGEPFDVTTDSNALIPGRSFGTVVDVSKAEVMVLMSVEPWVVQSDDFLRKGIWIPSTPDLDDENQTCES